MNTTDTAKYSAVEILNNSVTEIIESIPEQELLRFHASFQASNSVTANKCEKILAKYIESGYNISSLFTDEASLVCLVILQIKLKRLTSDYEKDINLSLLEPLHPVQ